MKSSFRPILTLIIMLAVFFPLFGLEEMKEGPEIEFIFNQKIPVRDGTKLAAYIWKPKPLKAPLPVIFFFSPYTLDLNYKDGAPLVQNGYIGMRVDCRGRGNSEGEFIPFEFDGQDGYDVVEWIAKQSWCDGQVGMIGGSYEGTTQWLTLKKLPPALKSIAPSVSAYPGIDFPQPFNIPASYITQWFMFVGGKTQNMQLFADMKYWADKFYRIYKGDIPFAKLAEITGSNTKWFKKYMAHPDFDDYWKSMTPTPEEYAKMNIPILSTTGYFDGDQPGALQYYREHMEYGSEEGKQKHYLIIGPWDHGGTRYNKSELGGLKFGSKSVVHQDMIRLYMSWFDWVLKGKEKPEFIKDRVSYYVMNKDEWRYVPKLEDTANTKEVFYLSSQDGQANDIFHSGILKRSPPTGSQKPDVYEYDPLDLVEKKDPGALFEMPSFYDQSAAFVEDKLIYHSPPLEEELEIAGYVKLKAFLELNVPDTDFAVALFEITPDGKSISLGQGLQRARYRNSLSKPELVKPGDINLYEIKLMYFFVRTLDKGSRIRLILTSLNLPDMQKNYNSGGVVAEETAKDARKAIIKLHHNKKYPSALELPVKKER